MIEFKHLKQTDPEVYDLVMQEYNRQNNCLELIASENEPSESVLEAQASYHTLKYAEGYPGKRYYGGCRIIDQTEQLAIDRVCKLFNCKYANVQPHSGANANTAVQFTLVQPGGVIMGMSLNSGGHLTHGAKPTFSGKYYKVYQYEVDKETFLIDYDKLEKEILQHRPRLFIAGASAYSRKIEFDRIRTIIDKLNEEILNDIKQHYEIHQNEIEDNGIDYIMNRYEKEKCYFMVDMAHIAGLVAAGLHQNPVLYADVVTSTTHKTLRGPRGGIILTNSEEIIKKVNKAVFPGVQGGPLENIIAAKAVCFGEALKPEFKEYMEKIVENTKVLGKQLTERGIKLLTSGTDNHLILLDLRRSEITGKELESRLEEVGIISNKNAVPFDEENKTVTSGLRLGAAAVTSRGLNSFDMMAIADVIADCVINSKQDFEKYKENLKSIIEILCKNYPLYKD